MAYSITLARAVLVAGSLSGLQDGYQGRVTQAAGSVTCISSGARGWAQRLRQKNRLRKLQFESGGPVWFHDDLGRSAFTTLHSGVSYRKDTSGSGPMCLIGGISGAFWEGADSENAANDHVAAKEGLFTKDTSVLLSLIQEIEPLDVSHISKETSADSVDAMKRTISGMLGLLPSDQFQVTIEVSREPLARLLVSSMMTGYTLRNAEYRLCLQRNLDLTEDEEMAEELPIPLHDVEQGLQGRSRRVMMPVTSEQTEVSSEGTPSVFLKEVVQAKDVTLPEGLSSVSPEVANYIQQLQAKLSATTKELDDCKCALTALEMERMVGDEQNDLLDYLRSLEPDKKLSRPTSSEVEEVIQQVINGIWASLCPNKRPPKTPQFGSGTGSSITSTWEQDGASSELIGNFPLQFQSTVTATRDYLARLLFWCMLLGHHMRGLEYRLELSRTLSLSGDIVLRMEEGTHE